MNWKAFGLMLLFSALVSTNGPLLEQINNILSKSPKKINEENLLLLGSDGFKGYTKTGFINITVFPIYPTPNCSANESCTIFYGGNIVTIAKQSSGVYNLNISRNNIPTYICFAEQTCTNETWRNWVEKDLASTINGTLYNSTANCSMICIKSLMACQTAKYDSSCSDTRNISESEKINKFQINGSVVNCLKCGSPLQSAPQILVPSEISSRFNTSTKEVDAKAAGALMKDLSSLLSVMGNLSVASVSLGSVEGVLKKISNFNEITESAFIYSTDNGIKIIEDMTMLKNYPNAFIVPMEATQKAFNSSNETCFMGVFRFPNMSKDSNNSTVLNNEVYAIEMGTSISNLSNPINLSFNRDKSTLGTPQCYSWGGNGSMPNWTTDGCHSVFEGNKITCKCEHLTFFAVLMAPPDVVLQESDLVSLMYLTYIGCGLSMFFLGIGLFMHFLLRKAKATNSVHVLINLFLALFLLNLAFLSNEYVARVNNRILCQVMAAFMHYCLLASFTWFAVEALHLCLQMTKTNIKHYIIKILVAGWVPPAFTVSIIFILGKYGEENIQTESRNSTMCWIVDSNVHYITNIGYYCFVFIFTLTTFIVVLRWLSMLKRSRWVRDMKVQKSNTGSADIFTILGLCCMLGLTWSISFFAYGVLRVPSYYIFTILNSLQGLFLFVYYMKTSGVFGNLSLSNEGETTEVTQNPYNNRLTTQEEKSS